MPSARMSGVYEESLCLSTVARTCVTYHAKHGPLLDSGVDLLHSIPREKTKEADLINAIAN